MVVFVKNGIEVEMPDDDEKSRQNMKNSYVDMPNGYLETINTGMNAVRYFNRKMSYGTGTRKV